MNWRSIICTITIQLLLRRTLTGIACFGLLAPASFAQTQSAQTLSAPDARSSDVEARAESLLDRARRLSDIRSPNAPPFRLTATFSFLGDHFERVEGTFTEVWVSDSQWRRETVTNTFRRIEIGGKNHIWHLDSPGGFPEKASQLPLALQMFPRPTSVPVFESITDHPEGSPPAECILTKPDSNHQKSAYCFDKQSGVLLEKIFPEMRLRNFVENSCDYAAFRKFSDFWVPQEISCFEDRHKKIDAKILSLSAEPSPDPALFNPPPGALEIGRCPGKIQPPSPTFSRAPEHPFGSRSDSEHVIVELSLLIDTKGKPQSIDVLTPGKKTYDDAAVSAVRSWRFRPATCDGEPIPIYMNVQVGF